MVEEEAGTPKWGEAVAIPDYQSLMLPVLKLASDGAEHRISDVVDALAIQLKLTDAEREELLPKGKQPTFNNRVHWAKTYLVKAKLLVATRLAHFKITERGQSVLAKNLERIDKKFLTQYDEFNAFVGTVPTGVMPSPDIVPKAAEEIASECWIELRRAAGKGTSRLKQRLVDVRCSPESGHSPTRRESPLSANT